MKKLLTTLSVAAILTVSLVGCTKTEQGAGIGAAVGALAGQAIGGDTGATLIGAGAGALLGRHSSLVSLICGLGGPFRCRGDVIIPSTVIIYHIFGIQNINII